MAPIKRHEALVHYSKEHHFGLLLGWKVRQGVDKNIDAERMKNYVAAACSAEIIPHFDNEERELFVLLVQDDPLRLKAETEHAAIRQKLSDVTQNATHENLKEFTDMLDAHIRFEERQLFPHIEQQQSFEAYASAMKAHNATPHNDFDAGWNDHFWKRAH